MSSNHPIPGPQDYHIPSIFGKSKRTMALMMKESLKRMELKEFRMENPGVGDYNVARSLNFTMNQAPSFMVGKSHRESLAT